MRADPELLIDGHHGVYVPQILAECCAPVLHGVDLADLGILRAGPEHPHYWDAWDAVLRDAVLGDQYGNVYFLYQSDDGDLWAIPIDWEWSEDADWWVAP